MKLLNIVLLAVGAVSFALAAFGVSSKINMIALGLLAWILVPLIAILSA